MNHSVVLGGCAVMVVAVLASWVYQNPVTGNGPVSRWNAAQVQPASTASPVSLIWSNDQAIRDGLEDVPPTAGLLTTAHYAPHLSQRTWIEMIPRAPVAGLPREATAIFLNLRDLRSWTCQDYFETLTAASREQFGIVYYRDGVVLIEKGSGDPAQLEELMRSWRDCA
jgi:hypothetical protein